MTSSDVNAFDNQFPVLRHHLDNIAGTPLVLARQYDDLIALLDLRGGHYSTSGARLMIFICFLPRSSRRSEEHTSELQSLMRISYAVFCLKKKKQHYKNISHHNNINHTSRYTS